MKSSPNRHLARTCLSTLLPALLLFTPLLAAQEEKVEYIPTRLSATVTMVQGQGGNIAVAAGADGVFIVDDQVKPLTDQLLAAIRAIDERPVRFVINTHFHHDHVGGNEALGQTGSVIIAHDNIRRRMSSDQFNHFFDETTPAWPQGALPVVTFNDKVTLHLNGEAVTAHHVPRGHTDGDSIVHFAGSNVLHMGDIFFNGLYPYIDLDGGGSIQGMIAAVDLALTLADDRTQVIPGHGPVSDRAGLLEYRDFLARARDKVQALVDQGMSLQQAVAARPTAEWDEALGGVWITPEQLVTFIYNSLTGVEHYTAPAAQDTATE
ncbi:MAG: MBL fold metallo-hydrolase [Xanthomonadales bacterium]|nr:MBL fold metallo-hydrolase [Xanthomonadales bacterium]